MGELTVVAGLRLALSFFTIAPVSVRRVDRAVAGTAMSLAPAVGAVLGLLLGGIGVLLVTIAGTGPALSAAVIVTLGVLFTRGLHLDGLADTADGLGSYRGQKAALEIMKRSDIGPFGVAAIAASLLLQVTAVISVVQRPAPAVLAGIAVAYATGRTAAMTACRRGVPAARETGLGALVAGTVSPLTAVVAALGIGLLAVSAVPDRPWQGPLAVLIGLIGPALLTRHTTRRLGGITGDTLGASIEIAGVLTLVSLGIGPVH